MYGDIGRKAFQQVEYQQEQWRLIVKEKPLLKKYKFNSPIELSYRENDFDYLNNDTVHVDLKPLFECILVHQSLGLMDQFILHYEADLKVQRDYLVPQNMKIIESHNAAGEIVADLTEISSVLDRVAGFCILDRIISRQTQGLRQSVDVDEMFDSLCQKIDLKLPSEINNIANLETIRKVKLVLGSFVQTMVSFNFQASGIQGILLQLFERYSSHLKQRFSSDFLQTMLEDDYMPMAINNEELYHKIIQVSWYKPTHQELDKPFPRILPFSQVYPLCCAEIRNFVNLHQSFVEDLHTDSGQVEDILRRALDELLLNTVCQTLEDRLKSTTREQIVQILINLEYFHNASQELEKLLTEDRISGRRGRVVLEATEAFSRARKKAEERIFELLNSAVDDLLDSADYDWRTTKIRDEPSNYLTDTVRFLKTMVNSTLVNLPPSIKSFVYFDAFDHLASSLLAFLLESSELTPEAIENFDTDVKYLETFVNELGQDANDMSLTTTVTELRQCVDLLKSESITEYNNTLVRMKKYDRVKPETAQILFSKITHQPVPQSSPQQTNTNTSKIMRYYRTGVDKLNDKRDRD